MQLGFVTAIVPEMPLADVMKLAADEGYACIEVMCWPPGKADRRYAGVSHLDVSQFTSDDAARVNELVAKTGIFISALGYYPNPLDADPAIRATTAEHLKKVITASKLLGLKVANAFVGRDHTKSVGANWEVFREVWPPLIRHAEAEGVLIGIEHCPMIFSNSEWPGGKNLPIAPAHWRRMFDELKSPNIGLNFDPSHLIWLMIDPARCIREFGKRIFHVHAKDARIDHDKLYEVGVMGLEWHTPKIPGMGDVDWGLFFSALTDAGYNGPVCVEVEDRAFEGSLEARTRSLRLSRRFLEQYV